MLRLYICLYFQGITGMRCGKLSDRSIFAYFGCYRHLALQVAVLLYYRHDLAKNARRHTGKGKIMENEITPADNAVYDNIRATLVAARRKVYSAVNQTMVEAYWDIGRHIMEAQNNNTRAEYGAQLLKYLSERLTREFGKGFDESSLRRMRQFYQTFPIRATLRHELSWSHYRLLMKISNRLTTIPPSALFCVPKKMTPW
jgi:hypothetical protein